MTRLDSPTRHWRIVRTAILGNSAPAFAKDCAFVVWSGLGFAACWLVLLFASWIGLDVSELLYARRVLAAAVILLLINLYPLFRIIARRRTSRLDHFRACPACAFDLSARAPEGDCPDCGGAYTHERCTAAWTGANATRRLALEIMGLAFLAWAAMLARYRDLPRRVRRMSFYLCIVWLLPLVLMIGWAMISINLLRRAGSVPTRQVNYNHGLFVIVGLQLTMLVPTALFVVRQRRAFARVKKLGCLVCTECEYALTELPAAGICPECGAAYTHDECRTKWKQASRTS